jgi:hypothetical protein
MSTTTFITPALAPTRAPRGARWAAALVARLWNGVAALAASRPLPARAAAGDAAALRAYASRIARDDPRYAADLFAAADRHERLFEAGPGR